MTEILSYGTLVKSLAKELESQLTFNWATIDWKKAIPALVFVGCLLTIFLIGIPLFAKWDVIEHRHAVYLDKEIKREKRRVYCFCFQVHYVYSVLFLIILRKSAKMRQNHPAGYDDKNASFTSNRTSPLLDRVFVPKKGLFTRWLQRILPKRTPTDQDEDSISGYRFADEDSIDFTFLADYSPQLVLMDNDDYLVRDNDDFDKRNVVGHVVEFLGVVIPADSLLETERSFFVRVVDAMLINHSYTMMLTGYSRSQSRLLRWLNLWRTILLVLFIETEFYNILYPPPSKCNALTDATSCRALLSPIGGVGNSSQQCVWTPSNATDGPAPCTLNPPPSDNTFNYVLSAIVLIVSSPFDLVLGWALNNVLSKRPDFELIGLSSNAWFGTQLSEIEQQEKNAGKSPLHEIVSTMEKGALNDAEMDFISRLMMEDLKSPQEEVHGILARVKEMSHSDIEAPLSDDGNHLDGKNEAKVKAIIQSLGVYPSGEPVPLSMLEKMWYGSPYAKMKAKIQKARRNARAIIEEIEGYSEEEEYKKDITLMQHFVLERVSVAKRYALSQLFFAFEDYSSEKVHPAMYFGAWIAMGGAYGMLFYFLLTWCIQNVGDTLSSWGSSYGIAVAQDMLLMQPIAIILMNVLAIELVRPQLRAICRTLKNVAVEQLEDGGGSNGNRNQLRVVQHLSATCRAARTHEACNLPSAQILRRLDDRDIQDCHENRSYKMGMLVFALVAIPSILAVVNDSLVESYVNVFVATVATGFLLVNNYLQQFGWLIVLIPYIIIFALWSFRQSVFLPALRSASNHLQSMASSTVGGARSAERHRWIASQRQRSRTTILQKMLLRVSLCISTTTEWLLKPLRMIPGMELESHNRRRHIAPKVELWTQMNMPLSFQGRVATASLPPVQHFTDDDDIYHGSWVQRLLPFDSPFEEATASPEHHPNDISDDLDFSCFPVHLDEEEDEDLHGVSARGGNRVDRSTEPFSAVEMSMNRVEVPPANKHDFAWDDILASISSVQVKIPENILAMASHAESWEHEKRTGTLDRLVMATTVSRIVGSWDVEESALTLELSKNFSRAPEEGSAVADFIVNRMMTNDAEEAFAMAINRVARARALSGGASGSRSDVDVDTDFADSAADLYMYRYASDDMEGLILDVSIDESRTMFQGFFQIFVSLGGELFEEDITELYQNFEGYIADHILNDGDASSVERVSVAKLKRWFLDVARNIVAAQLESNRARLKKIKKKTKKHVRNKSKV